MGLLQRPLERYHEVSKGSLSPESISVSLGGPNPFARAPWPFGVRSTALPASSGLLRKSLPLQREFIESIRPAACRGEEGT